MTLPCGCNFRAGKTISTDEVKEHFKHTFQSMVIWELIRRPESNPLVPNPLSVARIAYVEALETAFPEVKEE